MCSLEAGFLASKCNTALRIHDFQCVITFDNPPIAGENSFSKNHSGRKITLPFSLFFIHILSSKPGKFLFSLGTLCTECEGK